LSPAAHLEKLLLKFVYNSERDFQPRIDQKSFVGQAAASPLGSRLTGLPKTLQLDLVEGLPGQGRDTKGGDGNEEREGRKVTKFHTGTFFSHFQPWQQL